MSENNLGNTGKKKSLGFFSMLMMLSCGILNTDLISSNTAVGTSVVVWWIIVGIIYLIPSACIVGELTLAFPKSGGLYHWIAAGMNKRWGARSSWLYWCCGLFLPSASMLMIADLVCTMLFPQVGYAGRSAIAIVFLWLSIWISCLPMSESKYAFNFMGSVNMLVYVVVFVAGIIYVAMGNEPGNVLNFETMIPKMDQATVYLPVVVFCASGIEICAQSIEDSIDPKRDLFKSMFTMIIFCVVLNCIASIGILLIAPLEDMSIMSGIADIFLIAFKNKFLYVATIIAIILGIFSQICSWAIAGARGVAEAAKEGEFPPIFARETKAGLPLNAILINGIFSTIALIAFAFMADTAADLFFSLMGCCVIASLLPYVYMVIAYWNLKKTVLKDHNGYNAPLWRLQAIVLQIVQIFMIVLLVWIPGVGVTESAMTALIGGLVIIVGGELIVRKYSSTEKEDPKQYMRLEK